MFGNTIQHLNNQVVRSSYPKYLKNAIRLIVFNPDKLDTPVGSFIYRSQKFSDIDFLDNHTRTCCTLEEAKYFFSEKIRGLVFRVTQTKGTWLSNVKAGLDKNGDGIKWDAFEVLRGWKSVDGKMLKLSDAVAMNGIVNIEIFIEVMERYIEMSTFLVMEYYDGKGNKVNLNAPMFDLEKNVKSDIKKFFKENNPFKALKRLMILARLYKDDNMMIKIQEILSTNIGDLYIIAGDMDTLAEMLQRLGSTAPFDDMMKHLDEMKLRIAKIWQFNIDQDKFDMMIDKLTTGNIPRINIIDGLEKIISDLKDIIALQTNIMIKQLGILPLNKKYLL